MENISNTPSDDALFKLNSYLCADAREIKLHCDILIPKHNAMRITDKAPRILTLGSRMR
jgi:hypothetical protein